MVFRKNCFSVRVLFLLTLALLAVLIVVIVIGFVGIPAIINDQIEKQVRLEKGTDQWDRFIDLPVPFDIQVYLFEVLNPEEVMNGSLPHLRERGPYHYSETISKTILGIDEESDTVTYTQTKNITFDQEKSGNLSDTDKVVILNAPMLVFSQVTPGWELIAAIGCLNKIFPEEYNKMFIEVDIRTIVRDGYVFASESMNPGPACGVVRELLIKRASIIKNVEVIRDPVDDHVIELRFAFLQYRVREPDGIFTVKRGIHDITHLGKTVRWDGKAELPYWGRINSINNETCNRVRGTDATIYPPHVKTTDFFEIFSTDICRLMKIEYKGKGSYRDIDGYRFSVNKNILYSVTPNPENDCYCSKSVSDATGTPSCFLDGLVDVMPCFNAPVLFSWPHFLYSDEYRNGVEGLEEADPALHETYLLLEPNTGTPLEGRKRVQLNSVLRPVDHMPMTSKMVRTVLPMIWLDEGVSLTDDLVDELKTKYFDKVKIARGLKYALIAIAAACFGISTVFLIRKRYFHR